MRTLLLGFGQVQVTAMRGPGARTVVSDFAVAAYSKWLSDTRTRLFMADRETGTEAGVSVLWGG